MKMLQILLTLLLFFVGGILSLPVDTITTTTPVAPSAARNRSAEEWDTGLEYERYLKEIVSVLEDDEEFRKKMEAANPEHFKTGEIAKELNFVSHNVRSKLDEIKRREMVRLRALVKEQMEQKEYDRIKTPQHLDVVKEHFDEEDLKKLIQQATSDLQAADDARRKEFKEYEMNKEHARREKLKAMDERARQEEEKKFQEQQAKHKEHPALHHPGSKAQLEEVWEEADGLAKDEFDPKTFFMLHDLNQDNFLDQGELEALFQKELDKMYDPNRPEDDMRERMEEMARMREHVMKEVDKNRDGLISFDEFMEESKRQSFEADPGWETLDQQQPQFNENELSEYERQMAMHPQGGYGAGYPPPYPYQGQMPQHGVPDPNYGQYQHQYPGGGHPTQPPPHVYGGTGYQQPNQPLNAQHNPNYAAGNVGATAPPQNYYQQQQHQQPLNPAQNQGAVQQPKPVDPNSINSPVIAGGHR